MFNHLYQISLYCFCVGLGAVWPCIAYAQMCTDPVCIIQENNQVFVEIDWARAATANTGGSYRIEDVRISSNTSVAIRVKNFNFLNYTLQYRIEDEVIESYVTLERLWQQIFTLGSSGLGSLFLDQSFGQDSVPPFEALLVEWRRTLYETEREIDRTLDEFQTELSISPEGLEKLKKEQYELNLRKDDLNVRRKSALDAASRTSEMDLFVNVDKDHDMVFEKINLFINTVQLIEAGQLKVIGKKQQGTVVTANLIVKDKDQADVGGTEEFRSDFLLEYFSHSTLPLTFHVGYAHSNLTELDFEKVRALDGRELFTQISDPDASGTDELAAFLSYQVYSWGLQNEFGILTTLGTDLTKPGDKLYLGGGLKFRLNIGKTFGLGFNQILLNAGVASDMIQEGRGAFVEEVVDEAGNLLGTRELFNEIKSRREWAFYFSVSVSVF